LQTEIHQGHPIALSLRTVSKLTDGRALHTPDAFGRLGRSNVSYSNNGRVLPRR